MQVFFDQIDESVHAQVVTAFQNGGQRLDRLRGISSDVAAFADEIAGGYGGQDRLACKVGCTACCYLRVSITPLEVFAIAQYCHLNFSSDEIDNLKARLSNTLDIVKDLTGIEHAASRVPCALLSSDGRCSVYSNRPLKCRGMTSFSKAACDEAFESNPREAIIPMSGELNRLFRTIQDSASSAVSAVGLDGSYYELHSALLRALESADSESGWLSARDVFEGCSR